MMEKINISENSLLSLSSAEDNKIEEFRKSKQTAVLAILFSDVVNSTYATEKLGEEDLPRAYRQTLTKQKQDKKDKFSTAVLQGRLQKRLLSLLDSEASRSFSPTHAA